VSQPAGHRFACPLRWGDMDAQGHLNNAAFLDYLQEARVDYLLGGPPAMHDLLAEGVLVVGHQVEYLRPVVYHPRGLDIELWVSAVGGSRFGIAYEVRDGGEVAVRARTTAVPFDLASGVLRRLSAAERTVLTAAYRPTEPFAPLPAAPPTAGGGFGSPLPVRWSDLDSYGHVNNVKYFDYLQEARIHLFDEALGWSSAGTDGAGTGGVFLVRQDLEYRRPIDFRPDPYQVRTMITTIGNRSVGLAARIIDPDVGTVFATARSVIVAGRPLDERHRSALAPYAVALE
jgi:acyl-CoA thioester hydrolase